MFLPSRLVGYPQLTVVSVSTGKAATRNDKVLVCVSTGQVPDRHASVLIMTPSLPCIWTAAYAGSQSQGREEGGAQRVEESGCYDIRCCCCCYVFGHAISGVNSHNMVSALM